MIYVYTGSRRLGADFGLYDSMVHYSPDQRVVAQYPPPRCPRCGSHKTEIIGMSQDTKITYLRCATCGARSEVPSSHEAIAV